MTSAAMWHVLTKKMQTFESILSQLGFALNSKSLFKSPEFFILVQTSRLSMHEKIFIQRLSEKVNNKNITPFPRNISLPGLKSLSKHTGIIMSHILISPFY